MAQNYAYNDIRNADWFSRLMAKVGETNMRRVQATGSRPDDPYFAAKAAQEGGDLTAQRQRAFDAEKQDAWGAYGASAARSKAADASRNAVIRGALARDPQLSGVPSYLGTMADGGAQLDNTGPTAGALDGTAAPAGSWAPPAPRQQMRAAGSYMPYKAPSPRAPNAPSSGQTPAYNPASFGDDALDRARKDREYQMQEMMFQISNPVPMGRANPYVEALRLAGRR